ncbi:hypothetical protein Dsin_016044 [Dipteronia sinensis]|uniref:Tr-type G domain-containing protein n=1 Tax=Dipteronia sinensis TaxID=43782 RepID=A0AAE0AD42_9ROSI|nr:hypothetical protein Dsin_016044 [Dipteronia sinensis]
MRNQILANAGIPLCSGDKEVIEKPENDDELKENGMEEDDDDDDEEWDAKSWDDVNLNVKCAFDDEENDSRPLTLHNVDSTVDNPAVAAKKSQDAEIKKNQPEVVVVIDKTRKKVAAAKNKVPTAEDATYKQTEENLLRSPICCIIGHVDAGKTKLLDFVRGTNVQEGVQGYVNIAILVVDIMDGLMPQTIESLKLLKMRNTEFIIALNKVDRLYGWKMCRNAPIVKAMKQQSKDVQNEFNMKLRQLLTSNVQDDLSRDEWKLVVKLKNLFKIQ